MEEAADEITRLTAEVEQNAIDLEEYRRDVERLRAALCVCELELNAYYRMEYPGDHPYSQQELAKAIASNPATVALGFTPLHKETNND
jgi:RecB family endonuclease NucS